MARRQERRNDPVEELVEETVAEAEAREDLAESPHSPGTVSAERVGAENQARLARGEEPVVPENIESDDLTDAEKSANEQTFGQSVGVDTAAIRQSHVQAEESE